jgi:GTP diphosphokinase / guanosine-3',5'-bis(diphosphate) 3'-diphosphatase
MISKEEIFTAIQAYNPQADLAQVDKAIEFSAKAHEGQKRKSGEPYLIHPLEVAKILTQLKMDNASIIAAILHDTIEDTTVTKDDIIKDFGDEVAEIVDGVTKISKIIFTSQQDRQAENYRKMILAMSKDIRVIMVKLSDRLNNMRTLQFMPEAKQVAIAQETLDIFAPIAGRMGIYWIKEELEELSLKFLKPDIYKQISVKVKNLSEMQKSYMKNVTDTLNKMLKPTVKEYKIYGRLKKPYSIFRKMQLQQISLDDVHDLLAFRVLLPSIEQSYEVLGIIHSLWRPVQGRFKDYIAMPKPNNYQSIHTTVVCLEGQRVEFQIRSYEMHEIAEQGIAAHWKYKESGSLDTKDEAKFRWLRQLVDWQSQLTDSIEFVDTMKLDLFEDEIFIFTPQGDLKTLCQNATPIDFAYAIHSDVGNKCSGARVNGRIVPLNYKLESGDTIEIITSKNHVPSKDWLDLVVSSKAKTYIRQFIRKQQRSKSVVIGKNLFEDVCQKRKVSFSKLIKGKEFKTYLEDKNFELVDDFYIAVAYGKLSGRDALDRIVSKENEDEVSEANENIITKIFKKIGSRNKNLILVDQQDGVLVNFAKCCSPVKGDPIVGFVSIGRGVVVHRTQCSKVLSTDPDRRVNVDWNPSSDHLSLARLFIVVEDRRGMLADITGVLAENGVNITKVLVKSQVNGIARLSFDVNVRDMDELRKVEKAIESVKCVMSVVRE